MPANDTTTTVLALILSSGAGMAITAAINGWLKIRRGHARAMRENIDDLVRWREQSERRLEIADADVMYWRDVAGRRGWQLTGAGIEPYEPHPRPPSLRMRADDRRAEAAQRERERDDRDDRYERE